MELPELAKQLVAPSKGILAADESTPTIEKRFTAVGLKSTPELNRQYRIMLLSTPHLEKYLSGVIMFDETVRQKTSPPVSESDGYFFPEYLKSRGIIPGIKVDQGKEPVSDSPDESLTKGLEGLTDRLNEYKKLGLQFTKWRAEIVIGDGLPTPEVVLENARRLARFAKVSQEAGLLPIVEPEVIRDGNHDLSRCEEVTRNVLADVVSELERKEVKFAGCLLKVNMATNGKEYPERATPSEVATATLRMLRRVLPDELGGVVFLSGGQSPDEATRNLNAISLLSKDTPWPISFSFARALQSEALDVWKGDQKNVDAAQEIFLKRLGLVTSARQGKLK